GSGPRRLGFSAVSSRLSAVSYMIRARGPLFAGAWVRARVAPLVTVEANFIALRAALYEKVFAPIPPLVPEKMAVDLERRLGRTLDIFGDRPEHQPPWWVSAGCRELRSAVCLLNPQELQTVRAIVSAGSFEAKVTRIVRERKGDDMAQELARLFRFLVFSAN